MAIGVAAPATASAGLTHYGWLDGTDVLPERGAEVQTWVAEENGTAGNTHETSLWWGAVVGITDRLELALPVELLWASADGAQPTFTAQRFGVEARYRFVSNDPVDAPPFAPLLRIGVKRDIVERGDVRVETNLVVSSVTPSGSVHVAAQLGATGDITRDAHHFALLPGAGASFEVTGDLRLGAEVFAEIKLDSDRASWVAAGPNLGWTHGRFWLSAALGIGVYHIDTAPKVIWGIMF